MRTQSKAQRRYTAYHEAGHAVIRHRVCKHSFERVIVYDKGQQPGTWGEIVVQPSIMYGEANAANNVIEALAGPIAEAKHRKVSGLTIAFSTGAGDYQEATEMIDRLKRRGWPGADTLYADAARLVAHYWDEIVIVAKALNERGCLEYAEIVDLLQ